MKTGPGPGSGVVTSMNWVTLLSAGTRISGFRVGGTRSCPAKQSTPGNEGAEKRMNKGELLESGVTISKIAENRGWLYDHDQKRFVCL